MTDPYTPEKVAELVAKAKALTGGKPMYVDEFQMVRDLWTALAAVSAERDDTLNRVYIERHNVRLEYERRIAAEAERDAAIRDLDAGFAESDHLSAKYYQRMRDAEREIHARELHHFEEEQISANLEADRDRLHKAITEALGELGDPESKGPWLSGNIPNAVRRILRAALDKEGNDDE